MKNEKERLLKAIKEAMKGEINSIENYNKALNNSDNEEVKSFFLERMEEEKRHYNYLLEYYKIIEEKQDLIEKAIDLEALPTHEQVFTPQFIQRIGESQILFSAISVAILLEKNAMHFYQTQAEKTDNPELKNFFKLMAKWEAIHYDEVNEIAKQAEEKYWQANDFAPF